MQSWCIRSHSFLLSCVRGMLFSFILAGRFESVAAIALRLAELHGEFAT